MDFKHYFFYFLVNQKLSIKIKTEYMVHFFVDFLYMIISSIVLFIFADVLANNFNSVIGWDKVDFLTFFFLLPFVLNIGYSLVLGNKLAKYYIKKGDFNILLVKPGNIFFNYLFKHNRASQIFYFIVRSLIFLPFVLLYQDFTIFSFILGIIYCLFLAVNLLLLLICLDSFTWIFLELGDYFFSFFDNVNNVLKNYPGVFFHEMEFAYLLSIIPIYHVATVALPLFKGVKVDFLSSIFLIIILNLILIIIIIMNWRYGLRRYEAFG